MLHEKKTEHSGQTNANISSRDLRGIHDPLGRTSSGREFSTWMGKMAKKAAEGVWSVGIEVGSKVLVEAITKYYGLS
jgi:hypothetical protein